MSSIATCPHADLLAFPASDLINYKRQTTGAQHYVVSDGVREVQNRLAKGLEVRFHATVVAVKPDGSNKVRISWRDSARSQDDEDKDEIREEYFDRVVLAVSPSVVGAIYEPLREPMARIPSRVVTSIVHHRASGGTAHSLGLDEPDSRDLHFGHKRAEAEIIYFRTAWGKEARTEACHVQSSGVAVTTCPLQHVDPGNVLQESWFTRVLRTPESRAVVDSIFEPSCSWREEGGEEKRRKGWRNGGGGVWLAGGWCWDGMVLLEGCVASAMRVAEGLDVVVPWQSRRHD